MRRRVTEKRIETFVRLRKQGLSYRAIAHETQHAPETVMFYLNPKYREYRKQYERTHRRQEQRRQWHKTRMHGPQSGLSEEPIIIYRPRTLTEGELDDQ